MKWSLKQRRSAAGYLVAVIVMLGLGTVGILILQRGHAATSFISVEPENGTTTALATATVDTTASGNSAVKFNAPNTPSVPGFVHPGVLVSKAQLDFVRNSLITNPTGAPYADSYARTQTQKSTTGQILGSPGYVAHPAAILDCAADITGCNAIDDDSDAAYTLALDYYYSTATDRAKYAAAAINILNAWATKLQSTNGNESRLRTAFSAGMFAQGAEIIRYTYTPAAGQPALNLTALQAMFTNTLVPNITAGDAYSNGNWELSMAFSLINMGVFNDDRAVFDRGVALWRQRVPAYIYMTSDGSTPVNVPGGKYDTQVKENCYWAGAGTVTTSCTLPAGFSYHQGMVQESCRDLDHTVLGLNAMANAAETAHIQGVDLYGEQKARIVAGLEFTAQYDAQQLSTGSVPSWLCGGTLPSLSNGYKLGWEVAYNEYDHRLGIGMPFTQSFITNTVRPGAFKAFSLTAFQSLTHPGTP